MSQPVSAAGKTKSKAKKTDKKINLVYYKNSTWKTRWKWSLGVSGAVFSTVAVIYANSKTRYTQAYSDATLDEDKDVITQEIKDHEVYINIASALAALSIIGSTYLFLTDDSGVRAAYNPYLPELAISKENYKLSWGFRF